MTETTTPQTEAPVALEVGDTVHIGNGRTLWTIESLWDNGRLASLKPLEGYSGATVLVDRLVLAEKASTRP